MRMRASWVRGKPLQDVGRKLDRAGGGAPLVERGPEECWEAEAAGRRAPGNDGTTLRLGCDEGTAGGGRQSPFHLNGAEQRQLDHDERPFDLFGVRAY